MSRSYTLITGASSGIGEAFARALAARGHSLILVARRRERLETLATLLQSDRVDIQTVAEDLGQKTGVERLIRRITEEGWKLEGLVNNAGLGYQASLATTDPGVVDAMLQVNIAALVQLTRAVLPGLLERNGGFVLNIASTAGFQPVPYFAVYAASKAFVVSFSEALHEEVRKKGVQVAALCPGPVDTEFQKVAGMDPRFFARCQHVDEVVSAGLKLLDRKGAIAWTSGFQWWTSFGVRFLPRAVVRRLAAAMLRASGAR
jgi:short-subunit dehydrogenase